MIRFLQRPSAVKKAFLAGILLIICAALVITLVPGLTGDSGAGQPNVVAKVGSQTIMAQEVVSQAQRMGRSQFPQGYPEMFEPMLRQRAFDDLVMEKVLIAQADRMGLGVTQEGLREEMQKGGLRDQLFPNGKFIGQQEYQQWVMSNFRMGIREFEQAYKNAITINKLRNVVLGSVTVPPAEIEEAYKRQNTKVKFEYALVKGDDILKQLQPTDAELRSYYSNNKARYENSLPERRRIRYAIVETGSSAQNVQVTQADLERYYNEHKEQFRVPERVQVSHILVNTPPAGPDGKVDQAAVDASRKKAEDVLKQVKASGNFAELAKKYSADPGSAKEGGKLGWITKGQTVPEFEQAAFTLPKGQISDLVKTTYGFHILRVDEKQDAHLQSLEEVRAQIEPAVRAEIANRRVQELADRLQSQAKQGFEKAVAENKATVVNTELFARTDVLPGIGAAPEFMETVFSTPVKQTAVARVPQGYALVEVMESQPQRTPSFEEIKTRVAGDFKSERAQQVLRATTQKLSDRARAEASLSKAAKEVNTTTSTSDFVTASSTVADLGQMSGEASVVFGMKPGEVSAPVMLGNRGVVFRLLQKQEAGMDQFAQQRDQIREQLLSEKRAEVFQLFAANARKRMEDDKDIKINQQELARLTRQPAGGGAQQRGSL